MVKAHSKHGAVLDLHNEGHGTRKISELLNIPQRTVQEALKRFKELGTISYRPGRGRKGHCGRPYGDKQQGALSSLAKPSTFSEESGKRRRNKQFFNAKSGKKEAATLFLSR
ncbi:hypothetical protein Y032_0009g785 [Ancylostoma ceylanicum]|uniref:Paired domain-containing protein n=1 Tax=Ancylostoma ceylanicum TaxID=53326 RepID=A0A016VIZ2_9BILA|nr:hypothetical protein Y032_0009g785 [Ancylostoma ceylanicum]